MGIGASQPEPDQDFLHTNCHKTYVVTASHMDFIKIGYTRQPIMSGVWSVYRRAYGEDLEIIRIYPASHYKEDDRIHAKLQEQYGIPHKGQEIYYKKHQSALIRELDAWHEKPGVGPFKRVDILTMKQAERETLDRAEKNTNKPKSGRDPQKALNNKKKNEKPK